MRDLEQRLRCGIAIITHRHAGGNNPQMEDKYTFYFKTASLTTDYNWAATSYTFLMNTFTEALYHP